LFEAVDDHGLALRAVVEKREQRTGAGGVSAAGAARGEPKWADGGSLQVLF
jgi:hypothetical protein